MPDRLKLLTLHMADRCSGRESNHMRKLSTWSASRVAQAAPKGCIAFVVAESAASARFRAANS